MAATMSPLVRLPEAAEILGVAEDDAWIYLSRLPGAKIEPRTNKFSSYFRRSVIIRSLTVRDDPVSDLTAYCKMLEDRIESLEAMLLKMMRAGVRRKQVSPVQRLRIIKRDLGLCAYCGKKPTASQLVLDHKVPVSRGGNSDDSNLVVSCKKCNYAKGVMTDDEFLACHR
jgi:hypothetical protein